MKLILAIVSNDDSSDVSSALNKEKFQVTKLATTGGFLRSGNTTLLTGVEDDKLDGALNIISELCRSRKQIVTSPSPVSGSPGVYVPYPIEVMVGGATVFILDVDRFIKY